MKRPEPIPPNIDVGLKATVDNHADVLLITDGDADRCGIGDENGEFINQLRVFALLAYYLLEVRGERGTIVKTLSTTTMLNKLGEDLRRPGHRDRRGLQIRCPEDDRDQRADRRRGKRRLCLPRQRPRTGWHLGWPVHARFHGPHWQEAHRTAQNVVRQSRRAFLRPHGHALQRRPRRPREQ